MKPLYFARRLRFENGERTSTVMRSDTGMPIHATVLFINRYRLQGIKANTIHKIAGSLALLYRHCHHKKLDLEARLRAGKFLTSAELDQLADLAQYHVKDLDEERADGGGVSASKVRSLERMRMRRKKAKERQLVEVPTRATRTRHFVSYLEFLGDYYARQLPLAASDAFLQEIAKGIKALEKMVPRYSNWAKLGSRKGMSEEAMELLVAVVDPDSPANPWKVPFVRLRNFLIVVLYLAAGIRRGEMAGLQVGDLGTSRLVITIYRRADDENDKRVHQPVAKTADREITVDIALMQRLQDYLGERRKKKPARKIPQLWVTDDGTAALSYDSIGKIFNDIRKACPELPRTLTTHVLRHTWNDRFSEVATRMGLKPAEEEKARATHQGWSPGSKMPARYTLRTIEANARKVGLKLQQDLESRIKE
ncbi:MULTISPECIES: site-specific integrase [Ramlibacter]|uniref:Tyrosine-type recombinase/integrase n=1 Tax=Ramlibacter pinisoli TaxID=2682844 RepID=A0A6N8IN84_9BURK|nr:MULTISPECIES: site-specific integrase [Ramlibacter]MBA2960695.1 site-specific integrase [Ramlibacter sp. CGMCC 1.13660]MVQ28025.1 tyrosine-type recombinase/integrase [Ramlibacter pinisoli]